MTPDSRLAWCFSTGTRSLPRRACGLRIFLIRMEMFARTAPAVVAERIRDADIVITNKAPLSRAAIAGAQSLRLVAVAANAVLLARIEVNNICSGRLLIIR